MPRFSSTVLFYGTHIPLQLHNYHISRIDFHEDYRVCNTIMPK